MKPARLMDGDVTIIFKAAQFIGHLKLMHMKYMEQYVTNGRVWDGNVVFLVIPKVMRKLQETEDVAVYLRAGQYFGIQCEV
jgi:hypothetical protein